MERKKPEVTISIFLETRKQLSSGKHPVKLRITFKRERKYYGIKGESYTEEEFLKIMGFNSKGQQKEKKKKFEAIENRAIDVVDNVIPVFSFEAFEREYLSHKKLGQSVQSYYEKKIKELGQEDKVKTASMYQSSLASLLKFDPRITFEKITPQYLKKYEKWMLEGGNSYTTTSIYLRCFRHLFNEAIKSGMPLPYPFGKGNDRYSVPSSRNTKKALSIGEIKKLFDHKPENPKEAYYLKYWIFSYLCNGMNMVDIANLKFKNIKDGNIEFIRQKTKSTSKEIPFIKVPLLPEITTIIDDIGNRNSCGENYVFPILEDGLNSMDIYRKVKQHIKNTNKYVKRIAKTIGINENITTYWARHSYSTVLKRSGVPIEFIGEQLGHQSTQTTRNYLDSFEDEQRLNYSRALIPNLNNED